MAMYSTHGRDFICEVRKSVIISKVLIIIIIYETIYFSLPVSKLMQAHGKGIRYPTHMLITYGWYGSGWWKGEATSSQYNCTDEERARVMPYTLAPRIQASYIDPTAEDESGIVRYFNLIL